MQTIEDVQREGIKVQCGRLGLDFDSVNLRFWLHNADFGFGSTWLYQATSLDNALMWLIAYSLTQKNGGFC